MRTYLRRTSLRCELAFRRVAPEVRIATVATRQDCETAGAVFDRVWGMSGMVPNEVIIATVHAGGYASLAWHGHDLVGASWGFLGNSHGEHTLHSHVTGVLSSHGTLGVGAALKHHQWRWAAERGLDAITWTFDPLVRRNAHFNLVKLGSVITEYHEDFYGAINDGLNRGEHTDRVIVRWPVKNVGENPPAGSVVAAAEWCISTPPDIETMRRTDRAGAQSWRTQQRADLRRAFDGRWKIAGLMSDGSYAVVAK